MNPKKTKIMLAAAAFIIIVIILGKVISDGREKISLDMATTQPVLDTEWKYQQIGDTGLSMNVPDKLHAVQTVLDDEAKKLLQKYEAFEYSVGSFQLKINHIAANVRIDPRDYAEKLAIMLENEPDLKGYSHEIQDINQGMAAGVFMKGSGMMSDIDTLLNTMVLVKGTDLWEITMFVNNSNNNLKVLMEEVYSSVNIQ